MIRYTNIGTHDLLDVEGFYNALFGFQSSNKHE
jgi:hypothetical protein